MLFSVPLARTLGLVLNQTHPYSLWVGGVDMIDQVSADTIRITEAGPGGVSSMSFRLSDPTASFAAVDGTDVRMHDVTRDLPMFLGFIEHIDHTPWAANGRWVDVSCFGIEAVLDNIVLPSLSIGNQMAAAASSGLYDFPFDLGSATQLIMGFGPLRQFHDGASAGGTQAAPTGGANTDGTTWLDDPLTTTVTVALDGMTLRQAYEAMFAAMPTTADLVTPLAVPYFMGVDFWGGVRLFPWGGGAGFVFYPDDWDVLTVNNSTGGAVVSSPPVFTVDTSPGAIVNAVYVKGGAAASTGWVVGDTRTGRREDYTTTSSLTAQGKQVAGWGIINQRAGSAGRGRLTIESFTPINAHPGGKLVITDARQSWSSKELAITQIDKTIDKATGLQNWVVSFTDPAVSPAAGPADARRLMRTLTRAVSV